MPVVVWMIIMATIGWVPSTFIGCWRYRQMAFLFWWCSNDIAVMVWLGLFMRLLRAPAVLNDGFLVAGKNSHETDLTLLKGLFFRSTSSTRNIWKVTMNTLSNWFSHVTKRPLSTAMQNHLFRSGLLWFANNLRIIVASFWLLYESVYKCLKRFGDFTAGCLWSYGLSRLLQDYDIYVVWVKNGVLNRRL